MISVTVYDPPMCSSTGICGPEVDSKLARFAGDTDWLKAQGIEVRRINLAQEPGRFIDNASVKAILDPSGGYELPAIVVGLAERMLGADEPKAASGSCCGGTTARQERTSTGCC